MEVTFFGRHSIEEPIKAFCFEYNGDKIELIIDHIFSEEDSYDGIDFTGILNIKADYYEVHCGNYIFSTGVLKRFYQDLQNCYDTLQGRAEYRALWNRELEFSLCMTKNGLAEVNGYFQALPSHPNKLDFSIQIDQTVIKEAIQDLKYVLSIFDNE